MKKAFGILAILTTFTAIPLFGENLDSTSRNLEDYDFLTSFTEENYAAFPYIMEMGYKKKYETLKKQIRKQLGKGKIGIEQAACEYGIWFHKNFDAHYSITTPLWHDYMKAVCTDYPKLMEVYAPWPVSRKVDEHTWLVRVPSCPSDDSAIEWAKAAAEQYRKSGCENLIIDVRGNGGGSDDMWMPFLPMLVDHKREVPSEIFFRNSPFNRKFLEDALDDDDYDLRAWLEQCKANNNQFEQWFAWDGSDITPTPLPKRAAIIVDKNTCSSGESIAGIYTQGTSYRTKVYGKERTSGANLTGNCRESKLPHSDIAIYYPTTVQSSDFLNITYGETGIKPDVQIDLPYPKRLADNVDEWVLWVAKDLMNRVSG